MFTALKAIDGQQIRSISVSNDPLYATIKKEDFYADPINIKSYDKEKIIDVKKIPATFIDEKIYFRQDGSKVFVTPYFMIPNRKRLGIDIIPESEEHKNAKFFIYNEIIKKKELLLRFLHNEKITNISLSSLDINYSSISLEETFKRPLRRADIHLGFNHFHGFLGTGLIIEIQFSKQSDSEEWQRTKDYAYRGYSVAWLYQKDFEIDNYGIILKTKSIEFMSNAHIIEKMQKENIEDMRAAVRKVWTDVHAAKDSLIAMINNVAELPDYGGHCPRCYEEHEGILIKRYSKNSSNYFYGCSRFPQCNAIHKPGV